MSDLSKKQVEKLMSLGLSKQQAESQTAEKIINSGIYNNDSPFAISMLKEEAEKMMMISVIAERELDSINRKFEEISNLCKTVAEMNDSTLTDEKAKNAIVFASMYADICKKINNEKIVDGLSYVLYAYFGGEARKINYESFSKNKTINKEDDEWVRLEDL